MSTRGFYSRSQIAGLVDRVRSTRPVHANGRVFFVDGYGTAGNDGNNGDDPAAPLKTLTKALSLCVHDRGDIIIVLNYWQPTGETWPITISKNRVSIVGLANPSLPYSAIHPPADTAAFQLTSSGQYGEIAFLTIGGGAAHGGIEWGNSGQVDGYWIHDCWFGHQWFGTPLSGIYQPAASTRGGYGNRIEHCTFMGNNANCKGAITGNAIEQLTDTDAMAFRDLEVLDCIFKGCDIGINLTRAFDAVLLRNKFICPDSADGEAITLRAACLGCMADDNVGMNGGDAAMTNNPFRDIAATNKNHWGVNWKSNAVILPAQA